MHATPKTRKPVDGLTADDLNRFPIWEFALDEEGHEGRDETWVRPVIGKTVRQNTYSQLVASDFTTCGGHTLNGFMVVSTADQQDAISPGAIVDAIGYHPLPSVDRETATKQGYDWVLRERDSLVEVLRCGEEGVFPIQFVLRVPIAEDELPQKGTID